MISLSSICRAPTFPSASMYLMMRRFSYTCPDFLDTTGDSGACPETSRTAAQKENSSSSHSRSGDERRRGDTTGSREGLPSAVTRKKSGAKKASGDAARGGVSQRIAGARRQGSNRIDTSLAVLRLPEKPVGIAVVVGNRQAHDPAVVEHAKIRRTQPREPPIVLRRTRLIPG